MKFYGLLSRVLALAMTGGFALYAAPSVALAGAAQVGGVRMSCYAADVILDNALPGPGFALEGEILFNPRLLKKYPPIVQRLIFLHECAHQYVGADENAADCWAVTRAKRQGWLTRDGIEQVCRAIWSTVGDGTHLDGPARCQAFRLCFESAPGSN